MNCLLLIAILSGTGLSTAEASKPELIRIYSNYVTSVRCEGRLLISAIGNENLFRLEPLPQGIGCGVLIKPLSAKGRTNLFLETSTGTIEKVVEVLPADRNPSVSDLKIFLKGGQQ